MRRKHWIGISLAVLVLAGVAARLPGHGWTALAALLGAGAVSAWYLRRRIRGLGDDLALALPVLLLTTLAASLPFLIAGQVGILGAGLINDVRALEAPGAVEAAAATGAAVCLMHMRGEPLTMQDDPSYEDVVADVRDYLAARVAACRQSGIGPDRLCVDPGIGFGKHPDHNLALLASLDRLADPRIPVLVGVSRKSLVGIITGRQPGERLAGSVAFAALAVMRGATIVRAHDVAATVDAVKVACAVKRAGSGGRGR